MSQDNETNQSNEQKKQEDFSKKLKEVTKELKMLLADIIANRELTQEEKDRRALTIGNYLQKIGGTIVAISCKDGILMLGVNPTGKRNIFRIFHRICLLAVGKSADYKDIHLEGLISVLRRWLDRSKADIDSEEITEDIAKAIEENFNYFKSKRGGGPYKANFIISKLGFDADDDFISAIDFEGTKSSDRGFDKCNYAIMEMPLMVLAPVKVKIAKKSAEDKNDGKIEFEDTVRLVPQFIYPASEALGLLAEIVYSQKEIWSIREAALFVGLILFLFNNPEHGFEIEYLDRNMLRKTNLGDRRFHHIWNSITVPNPYKKSDPYQNWKKFTAPIRREIKKGGKYPPEFKILFELLDVLYEKKAIDEKGKELLEKMTKEDIGKLLAYTLQGMMNKK